jgi:transposase
VDAQIKLSVVASDVFGVSGRAMLAALVAGERDPKVLAQLARARMRAKLGPLVEAFTGLFTDQHAFLLAKMLARVDALDADLAELDAKLQELIAPFAHAVDRLDEICGVGQTATHLLIAEIGTDMTRFPTAGHLVSWAKFAPGVSQSAGNPKGSGSTGHGNPDLARVLGEVAVAASKTDTFLGERYRPIARRRGKKPAIVAVGRSILVIVWHLLSDPEARFHDLGPGLLRHRYRSRTRQGQPRPPAGSPRRQGHPRPRRLTGRHRATGATLIGSGRSPDAAACPPTVNFRIRMRPEVQVQPGPQTSR